MIHSIKREEFVMNAKLEGVPSVVIIFKYGPVADDSVYDTLFLFESGYITREEAIRKLNSAKLDGQILFHTDKSLECITYIDSWEVE